MLSSKVFREGGFHTTYGKLKSTLMKNEARGEREKYTLGYGGLRGEVNQAFDKSNFRSNRLQT